MDTDFLQSRIDKCKELIVALESLIETILLDESGDQKSYSLNTGQSVLSVTRYDLPRLERMLSSLENRCVTLEARLNGATTRVTPGW